MSGDFRDVNPYASPYGVRPPGRPPFSSGKVMAPAIALVAVAVLGLGFSLFNVVNAFGEPKIDPNVPQWLQDIQKGATGPAAAIVQSICAVMNLFIIVGAVQMMRIKMWGLALAAAIVAMLNFGSCCCIAGIPVGIWSIIVLMMEDVKVAFRDSPGF